MPYEDSRTQQEEERLPLLAWQELSQEEIVTSQPMKSLELFVYSSPPNSFLPSLKEFFSPFLLRSCTWLAMAADPELQLFVYPK